MSQFTYVRVPLLCSFLLFSFSVASTKPATLHSLRWLPGSRRGVLLAVWGRYDLTRATVNLLRPQRSRQAEDGILGPCDAWGGKLSSDNALISLLQTKHTFWKV